ncbi:serine hydrolase [Bacillus sp. M6-12]|uniref:serine hydrolase domain-containing protein n=1 Tax=Bacillus sp. M6-12 TaxID=2054166 RepID=UPI000C77F13F|nr:serine hydrolase domain-containing protein [Bacillus sp. M6-12]PLS18254.1 serine hydrolase [Bacillus sp. M6-12]
MDQLRQKELDEYVTNLMQAKNIPGAAIAVSKNGELVYQKGFGYRDVERKELVTPETIFGIASVSKSFTAMAIMKLEQEGRLSVTDPVIKYIPEFTIKGVPSIDKINIHHLLSHTSGVPPMNRREDLDKLDDHICYFAEEDIKMLGNPGEYFSYCNDTFLLLGLIIERITGQLFRRYITSNILEPLGMNRSTFSLEEISKLDNISVPYEFNRKTKQFEQQPWPKLGNYEVGGGIRSNVLDLIKYGQQYIDCDTNDQQILSKKQINKMGKAFFQISEYSFYGFGLTTTPDYSGITLIEHGGGQPGVSSHFGFAPEKKLVIAVLTNISGAPSADLWLGAVNAALDLPIERKRYEPPVYESSQEELLVMDGSYASAEGSKITVTTHDGMPKVTMGEESLEFRSASKDMLWNEEYGLSIRFYVKSGEKAWAVLFGSRMLRRIAEDI